MKFSKIIAYAKEPEVSKEDLINLLEDLSNKSCRKRITIKENNGVQKIGRGQASYNLIKGKELIKVNLNEGIFVFQKLASDKMMLQEGDGVMFNVNRKTKRIFVYKEQEIDIDSYILRKTNNLLTFKSLGLRDYLEEIFDTDKIVIYLQVKDTDKKNYYELTLL